MLESNNDIIKVQSIARILTKDIDKLKDRYFQLFNVLLNANEKIFAKGIDDVIETADPIIHYSGNIVTDIFTNFALKFNSSIENSLNACSSYKEKATKNESIHGNNSVLIDFFVIALKRAKEQLDEILKEDENDPNKTMYSAMAKLFATENCMNVQKFLKLDC